MKTNALTLLLVLVLVNAACANKRPNLLFIAVDDLQPEIGCQPQTNTVSQIRNQRPKSGFLIPHIGSISKQTPSK
jgi:hypothetical protein